MIYVALALAAMALVVAVVLAAQLSILRKRLAAVPRDGDVVAYLRELDTDLGNLESTVSQLEPRVSSVEQRVPHALSRVGVVTYDAFGNITGNLSRSVAVLDEAGSGVVITVLVGRAETMFYTKQVKDGLGIEELSPEEQACISRALDG